MVDTPDGKDVPDLAQSSADVPSPPDATATDDTDSIDVMAYIRFLLTVAVCVFLVRSLVVSSFNIPSESMQPRLQIGDYLFVNKFAYGWSRHSIPFSPPLPDGRIFGQLPARGDVVVIEHPIDGQDYIKRVIGLPGDRVQVIAGQVHVNGQPIPRRPMHDFIIPVTPNMIAANFGAPCFQNRFEMRGNDGLLYCRYPRMEEQMANGKRYQMLDIMVSDADNTPEYRVPAGQLFLMGDNRDRSYDSRFPPEAGAGLGMVSTDNLIGKAAVVFFSTDGSAKWYDPVSWFSATRWDRIGQGF